MGDGAAGGGTVPTHQCALRDLVCSLPEPGFNYGHIRSPFYRYEVELGATFVVYNGRLMPVSLATSTREEGYWALRRGVTRLNTGELVTELRGRDAAALLDRIFTRRMSSLEPGRCRYALACWPDGGVMVDGILIRISDDRFWYVQADGEFSGWASGIAVASDLEVAIADPGSWVQQIQGPRSFDLLADLADHGMPDPFRYFDLREISIAGQPCLITRTGWTGELGFEIYTLAESDTDAIYDRTTAIGARHGLLDIGLDPMDVRRIEAAILNNLSDMDRTMTPFEAGLGALVDLDRDDDFFGKQALLQADRRTRIYGVRCPTAEPLIGGFLERGGEEIGTVTAAGWSPYLKSGVALVRLHSADQADPRNAHVTGFDLRLHDCEIIDLPFYDADKLIPRGLAVEDV
jgi:glycine cleavage system aminomethyltransferase T